MMRSDTRLSTCTICLGMLFHPDIAIKLQHYRVNYDVYEFFAECGCPKGDPSAVPPLYAQKCDSEGTCYCQGDTTMAEGGCKIGSMFDRFSRIKNKRT